MRPIFEALTDEKLNNQIQFHMPGHLKGRGFFDINPEIDVTELYETDDLHNPTGVIKKSQEHAAEVFGAKKAYYLVNGSTSGVISMVMGFVGEGEKIIADRFCHKSFVSALALSGADCVWVYPTVLRDGTMWGSVSLCDIEKAINENPDAKAVYLTAPNYFGLMGDIKEVSRLVHKHNMYLLVDSAHGAHYGMYKNLPPSVISQGADAVCMSLHKTLPSLTQSAILLTNEKYPRVEKALKTVQSSSPSYILISSCEYAVEYYEKCKEESWNRLYSCVKKYFPEQLEEDGVEYKDFTRLNCHVKGNPFKAAEILREKYNIAVECSYGGGVVAILNAFHTEDEIKKLKDALDLIKETEGEHLRLAPFSGEKVYSPRKAFFAKTREVNINDAAGLVSADGIMVYPPGVYQVLPGERITSKAAEAVLSLLEKGAEIPSLDKSNCLIFDE